MPSEKDIVEGINYKAPQKELWTGRKTNPSIGNQYWYQEIQFFKANNLAKGGERIKLPDVALLGYACDEGVRRNMGRVGAKEGPVSFRKKIASLPFHHGAISVGDFGDILCSDQDMENSQNVLSNVVKQLISSSIFPIVIGGGHDLAYAHFGGIKNAVRSTGKSKIGIINFDAHFDLRPVDEKSNSGTPFNQILSESNDVDYLVVGLQKQSNTKELFNIAKTNNVQYIENFDCVFSNIEVVKSTLLQFIERNDYIYLSIDLDGFSSAYAPGVSAPSPLGFSPMFAFDLIRLIMESKKVVSCDIAELNPLFDVDNATSILAARLADFIISCRLG